MVVGPVVSVLALLAVGYFLLRYRKKKKHFEMNAQQRQNEVWGPPAHDAGYNKDQIHECYGSVPLPNGAVGYTSPVYEKSAERRGPIAELA